MRIPHVSIYSPADFDEVSALIRANGFEMPLDGEELARGLGIVARDERDPEGPVVGFIWALAAEGNPVAYADYFVVRRDMVGTRVAPWIVGVLARMLSERGVRRIFAFVPNERYRTVSMLVKRGARDLGQHHVLEVNVGKGAAVSVPEGE